MDTLTPNVNKVGFFADCDTTFSQTLLHLFMFLAINWSLQGRKATTVCLCGLKLRQEWLECTEEKGIRDLGTRSERGARFTQQTVYIVVLH